MSSGQNAIVATDETIHNVYRRHPLSSRNSIRLLRLKPAQSGRESTLEAELSVASLNSATESFVALSYVWGPPNPASYIHIGADKLTITPNLYQFLIRLRDEGIGSPLWADAICIDQRSGAEKNHQIPLMSTIYSRATDIRCWLGNTMHGIADCMKAYSDRGDLFWSIEPLRSRMCDAPGILEDLLQHSYWTRTWILQEVILAQSVTVHCLHSTLRWDAFVRMTKRLCAKVGFDYLSRLGQSRLMRLHEERTNSEHRTLPGLLQRYRATECLDRRDRVFALVGLINAPDDPLHCATMESDGQQAIANLLDYSLSLPTLLVRFWEHYRNRTTEGFAVNLWEVFDLDHHDFHEGQLNMFLRIPAHINSLVFDDPYYDNTNLPWHRLLNDQRGKWIIMGDANLESETVDGSSILPSNGGQRTRVRIHEPEHRRITFESLCSFYACNMSLVQNKYDGSRWVSLLEIAHDVFEGSDFVYRRLPDSGDCGCYVEITIASYKLLRDFLNSKPSTPLSTRYVSPSAASSSRFKHRIPTTEKDVQRDMPAGRKVNSFKEKDKAKFYRFGFNRLQAHLSRVNSKRPEGLE